jgi:hypothetical protein
VNQSGEHPKLLRVHFKVLRVHFVDLGALREHLKHLQCYTTATCDGHIAATLKTHLTSDSDSTESTCADGDGSSLPESTRMGGHAPAALAKGFLPPRRPPHCIVPSTALCLAFAALLATLKGLLGQCTPRCTSGRSKCGPASGGAMKPPEQRACKPGTATEHIRCCARSFKDLQGLGGLERTCVWSTRSTWEELEDSGHIWHTQSTKVATAVCADLASNVGHAWLTKDTHPLPPLSRSCGVAVQPRGPNRSTGLSAVNAVFTASCPRLDRCRQDYNASID